MPFDIEDKLSLLVYTGHHTLLEEVNVGLLEPKVIIFFKKG